MKIEDVLLAPTQGGYFYDDLAAIRQGAVRDGQWYGQEPVTAGFTAIRVPARALGIGLKLDGGGVAWGDAVSVQYAGAGGRDPVFAPDAGLATAIAEALRGLAVDDFRPAVHTALARMNELGQDHPALRYGLSQALLGAAAKSRGATMCEVLCAEFGLPVRAEPIPVYTQSGEDVRGNADKMILKRVDALPHGLVNTMGKFGVRGETLLDYLAWLVGRIRRIAGTGYRPTLHFDLYGMAGIAFELDVERVADYLARAEEIAAPFELRVETPLDLGGRDAQIEGLGRLRTALRRRGSSVRVVADEWCNTLADIEAFVAAGACDMVQVKMPDLGSVEDSVLAVRLCKDAGTGAFLGGSCTETEVSARVSVHVALAARPDMQLAKPGMGVDEGLMIVTNEQARTLALLGHR